jgi:hypothetical protein
MRVSGRMFGDETSQVSTKLQQRVMRFCSAAGAAGFQYAIK